MGGGLMQLVAYGAQDIYLSGNPQITFFKVVYRRHTNFAVESIEQTFNGSAAAGSKISVTVSRNGDLLSQVWLANTVSTATGITAARAFSHIDNVEVEIGGQVIDKQYGHWMQVWTDLSNPTDKSTLLGNCAKTSVAGEISYVPLQFWFCRNPGLALPLIALQYHEVKLNITFSTAANQLGTVGVWCDYVFLDTDERRRFAQVSHEYLIEQVQYSNALSVDGTTTQHELRFNHPVKELVWTVHGGTAETTPATVPGSDVDITCESALLQLNGHDRFKRRNGKYFTEVQRYQHHSGSSNTERRKARGADGVGEATLAPSGSPDLTLANGALKYKASPSVRYDEPTYVRLTSEGDLTKIDGVAVADLKTGGDGDANIAFTTQDTAHFRLFPLSGGAAGARAGLNPLVILGSTGGGAVFTTISVAQTEDKSIPHVYSFALKPEEHQPSGTCNFSRIDNAVLNLKHANVTTNGTLNVYAVNYNVLRIMSGMGGLAYSN
jgi:hypothetical protein